MAVSKSLFYPYCTSIKLLSGAVFLFEINLFCHATIAAIIVIKINNDNAFERPAFSEIKPIMDGPVRKPINPPVVTIAKPSTN